ncbi:MAG: NAD-dependent epimerase/dehydratase family protein [Myxococcota bacterium]
MLVTGGAGFIGSHVVDALLARGDEVGVLDAFHPYYPREIKERNLAVARQKPNLRAVWETDVRDAKAVGDVLDTHAPEAVIHLAARAGVRPSLDAPEEYADVNVTGTAILLHEAAARGIERFLFASSSSVYGEKPRGPFVEELDADHPISPYGATKRSGELLAYAAHKATGISVACIRIFTAYGPRQRPDLAIHTFARRMLAGEEIPLFGDGSAERDFTFVGDLTNGILRALDRIEGFATYNLGSGEPVTMNETIATLERVLGVSARRQTLAVRPGDVPRTWASIDRASRELGYAPQTSLEEGICEFATWLSGEGACVSS